MTFGWHLASIGIEFHLECVGMAHEICWNVLECVGMAHGMGWNGLEWVGMAHGMAHGMGWNLLEWPSESSRMNLKSVGMEFHLDSIGICWNGFPLGFHQNPVE